MISDDLADQKFGERAEVLQVLLSNELVHLLSDQLYQSPLKAIEELVVNSYDADAGVCRLFVPDSSESSRKGGRHFVAIFDDGTGLSSSGMTNLWHVGKSNKRTDAIATTAKRTQIGKFGIGKLATYTIAGRLTYISKSSDGILSASLDFSKFTSGAEGAGKPVEIQVMRMKSWDLFAAEPLLKSVLDSCMVTTENLAKPTWTIAILEALKPKASQIKLGMLRWVLSTAMPLKSGFTLYLNGAEVVSSKENIPKVLEFKITDLPKSRLEQLKNATGDEWTVQGDALISNTFPQGIRGTAMVTEKALAGKSDDLLRSNGFFVRVLGRLINQDQSFFGMAPLHHGTLSRFRADIDADDLDKIITAPREGIENSSTKDKFEKLLVEVFQEARQRYEKWLDDLANTEQRKKEHNRNFVSAQLIEYPIAGALLETQSGGAEADNSWFYLGIDAGSNPKDIAAKLYTQKRTKFSFQYGPGGKQSRIVRFNPESGVFSVNSDHEFIAAYSDEPSALVILEDMLIAEALLEVHLRVNRVPAQTIGEVLQERDRLLRGLALDHPFSGAGIAKTLRDSANNEYDLELAVVAAARALGFVAKHISGEGEPDGIARFVDYPKVEQNITLEAKSSGKVPSLSQLDFAGLAEHVKNHNALGCLLVAPDYPGATKEEDSAASRRANEQRISCWTIDQLARVVEAAESRHFTAKQILEIILEAFDPPAVTKAIDLLFQSPLWDQPSLIEAIIQAFDALKDRLLDSKRTVGYLSVEVSGHAPFQAIKAVDVKKMLSIMQSLSSGGLILDGDDVNLLVSVEELRRRIRTDPSGMPMRASKLIEGKHSEIADGEEH